MSSHRPRLRVRLLLIAVAAVAATLPLAGAGSAGASTSAPDAASPSIAAPTGLSFIGEKEIPYGATFKGTTVGGLSAISYDGRTGKYVIISDDRSNVNPARFYTASIDLSGNRLRSVTLTGTHPWLQPDGTVFPRTVTTPGQPQTLAPDPEGIAVDPRSGRLAWSSEGERIVPAAGTTGPTALEDPWVRIARPDGQYVNEFALPPQFHMNTQTVGPRQNQTLEGLSYSPDGTALFSAMEDPLYQDGADPTPSTGGLTRVTKYDPNTGMPSAQWAYPLSALFRAGSATDTNGVSDILALGGGQFLVLERAAVFADNDWRVRIFLASSAGATNVLSRDALTGTPVQPMTKKLLVDLTTVPGLKRVDNVEGLTFGPRLADGRRSLVLVSDNNFYDKEITQVIAFAVNGS